MPTGYTEAIQRGISFNDFVMRCARAMGACVMMRDDPMDKPIPERFEPSDYHTKKLKEIEEELSMLRSMSPEQMDAAALIAYEAEINYAREGLKKNTEILAKYKEMLRMVRAWNPPTSDHDGLKQFMIDQITSSINFDCSSGYYTEKISTAKRLSGQEWKDEKEKKLLKDMAYHTKEKTDEIYRTESRNEWIKALRESLA